MDAIVHRIHRNLKLWPALTSTMHQFFESVNTFTQAKFNAQLQLVELDSGRCLESRLCGQRTTCSASFLAELSVSSPRKLFIFFYLKKKFLDQSIQKRFYFILKKEALTTCRYGVAHLTHRHAAIWGGAEVCRAQRAGF